jgi:hypothetical protein
MLRWLCGVPVVVALAGVAFVGGGFAAKMEKGSLAREPADREATSSPADAEPPAVRAEVAPAPRGDVRRRDDRVRVPARPRGRTAHNGGAPVDPRRAAPPTDYGPDTAGGTGGGPEGGAPDRGPVRGTAPGSGDVLPDDRSDTFPDGIPGMSPDGPR